MMRRIAVVGDALRDGGTILPYSGRSCAFGNAGHQAALIGGQAYCESCKSVGIIFKTGGPRRIKFMSGVALDGDGVLCKCPSPQHIVAMLAGRAWHDDGGGGEQAIPPSDADLASAAATVTSTIETAAATLRFDDRFVLRDAKGQPLPRVAYAVGRESGLFEYGETDSQGHTHLLSSAVEAESINIFVAG